MADDDQQYGLQAVDHDPFAVDPMAEPAAISLPPDQPKPEASPQTTPAPAGDGWDRWGAVGGAMKLATAVAHPGSFTNLVADKLSNLSMPTREQWQTGEQALGHTAEHLATLPMRIADKLGLLEAPTATETPGQVSESDVEKEQARAAAEGTFGASTALQMVLGGPGAAEEGAAAMGMRGKLTQPDAAAEAARVDQRLPTAKKPIESEGPNRVDTDAMRLTPKSYENNVGLVRNYPGVKIPPSASTDAASDAFVDHVKDNLLWLYDQVPDDIKARSSQWYDGGNKIAKDWANKYDVPDSTVAGVIAATSPQKDWYNNVSIAKRILDTTKGDRSFYENQKTTPEMEQFFRDTPSLNKPELQPIFDEIRGKSLADIDRIMPYPEDERDIYKALWIRLHDQAHVDPSYPLITPEGNFGPTVNAKNTEEPTRVAWGSLPEIAKAVNIVNANGDPVALNQMMGFRHKVRNFYNNLISPMSQAGDVTIDTHAVAAGLLRPVTANSLEVYHNFGNSPGEGRPAAKNSRKTGLFGTYPLYADAYREAAAEAGVLPRQLQSVTWEAVRGLFPEDWKSAKNSAIIDNIWRQYRSGKETLDGARQRILNTTGGIQPPSWYRPARANNAPTQGAGNAPELFEPRVYGPGSQPSFTGTGRGTAGGASAPVVRPSPRDLAYEFDFGAGAPYNEQFPGWSGLSGDQKATISKAMLDKIADHAKEVTGANEYARLSGLGGWHEFTNPSYKSRLVATPEVAGDFADTMGYLAQQTKIIGYRPDPAGDRLGLALYGDGLGDEKKLAAFWRDVNDKYPDFSSGFSPSRNQRGQPGIEMLFDKNEPGMAERVKSELIPGLQRLADDHAIGKVDSGIFRATEESREHDWQKDPTGGDYTSRLLARHGPDLLKRLELFKREELEPELQRQIAVAQGTGPGRTGDRGAGVQETQGAPSLPFRAAASPVKLGSGITDERTAAVRAAATAAAGRPNLIGLPTQNITLSGKPFVPGPIGAIHDIAEKYMADAGLPYDPPKTFVKVDKDRARRVAQAFDDMKHAPDDPQVKASYDAMAKETVAQYRALKNSGIKFEFIKPGMDDPYAENPRAAAQDVINNKHLWVFPTEGGFGSGSEAGEAMAQTSPLLRPSGEKIEGKEVPVNDLFRIVHDVFGHLKDGVGFRADGEENAWRSHSAMYSDAARPAMTSETRGQNSWVNYGPHGDFNRTASGADTKYADQKIGLLPKWAVDEGRGDTHDFQPVSHNPFVLGSGSTEETGATRTAAALEEQARIKRADEQGYQPGWYHGTTHEFNRFGKGSIEGHLGSYPHFTSSAEDAGTNYAGVGPDLTNRIENRADQIAQDLEDARGERPKYGSPEYKAIYKEATERATEELKGAHEGAVMPARLRMANPVNISKKSPTWIDLPPSRVRGIYNFMKREGEKYNFSGDVAFNDIAEKLYDGGISANELDGALRGGHGELMSASNDRGELASHQVIVDLYKHLGFDGVIMNANEALQNMKMPPNTMHAVVFNTAQVRSEFAQFDPANKRKSFLLGSGQTSESNAPRFFSAVEQAVNNAKIDKAPASQWLGTIKNTPGVKPEELDWLGLEDWLKSQKGAVTKQALQDYVRSNKVDVQEVMKGGDLKNWTQADSERLDDLERRNHRDNDLTNAEERERQDLITRENENSAPGGSPQNMTKHSQWVLPGGQEGSYRELLLTMPDKRLPSDLVDFERQMAGKYGQEWTEFPSTRFTADEQEKLGRLNAIDNSGADQFKTSHWDEPNVLAHVRFDDRNIDGDKSLHMAEVQSDWHQKGRKEGYTKDTNGWTAQLISKPDAGFTHWQINDAAGNPVTKIVGGTEQSAIRKAAEGVPNAPFKSTWHELALKRMIRYAAENGYDRLSWDTGATNADRYDLSKHLTSLEWHKDAGEIVIKARDKNGQVMFDEGRKPESIDDIVGKDIADKIRTDADKKNGGKLEGLDLKVGGEGMNGFYDKILPTAANKLVKKYGAKVEDATMPFAGPDKWLVQTREGQLIPYATEAEAHAAARSGRAGTGVVKAKAAGPVHSIKITPELRKAAMSQGFPTFAQGGAVSSTTQPSLNNTWEAVRNRAYGTPKEDFNPDNTGIDIIPGAHLPDEQRGGMKARDIRGSASGGPVPPRGGDIGNVQSTVAPLVQALDQAVPDFDPEALGFRPSTNVEDVRNKPDWQREIESMTRAPLGIPAHDWPGAAINTNFGVLRAHGGRVEPKNINHAPTEAQKEAGNYAKDHVHIHGLPITIENAKGKTRRGVGRDGKPWEVTMPAHYGYIKQTEGSDGDHVDVYVGPHIRSPHVYVIDQVDADTKKWDEHKIMLGFGSEAQAVNTYKRGFSDGKGANRIGTITGMTVAQFREWLKHGDHGKPFRHAVDRKDRVRDILHRHGIQNGVTP